MIYKINDEITKKQSIYVKAKMNMKLEMTQ